MEADSVERFGVALHRLTGEERPALGIAVSGGPDSLALLLLAHRTSGGRLAAATIDHRLREESADEARHVAGICADLGVPHAILAPATPITGNLQAGAREARYALLEEWRERAGLDWIATAHHADDQLETMVMRLLRGSGIDGLAAIRVANRRVIRPLLGFRRSELQAIVDESRFAAIDDPSNRDTRFDRVRLRRVLERIADIDPGRLARSAEALRDASAALDWATRQTAQHRVSAASGRVTLDADGLPAELRRRLVLHCLERIAPEADPAGPALDALIAALEEGEKRTLAGVACEGGRRWRFSPAPARKTG